MASHLEKKYKQIVCKFHGTFRPYGELERVRKKDPMHPSPAVHLPNRYSNVPIKRLCTLTRHALLHHVDIGQRCTYHRETARVSTIEPFSVLTLVAIVLTGSPEGRSLDSILMTYTSDAFPQSRFRFIIARQMEHLSIYHHHG